MPEIQLSKVHLYVQHRKPFNAARLHSLWINTTSLERVMHDEVLVEIRSTRCYVIYSHETYPLFVYDEQAGHWFGNTETINPLCARHQARCRPQGCEITLLDTPSLQRVVTYGYATLAKERLLRGKKKPWREELNDLLASLGTTTKWVHSGTVSGRISSKHPLPQLPKRGRKP